MLVFRGLGLSPDLVPPAGTSSYSFASLPGFTPQTPTFPTSVRAVAVPGAQINTDGTTIVMDPLRPPAVDQGGDYQTGQDGSTPPPPMPPPPPIDQTPVSLPPQAVVGLSPLGWVAVAAVGLGVWWFFFGRH